MLAWPASLHAQAQARAQEATAPRAAAVDGATATPRAESPASISESLILISQGIELRKQGDDRRALIAFEQAWELGKSPQALAQRALAEQALGHWLDAHQHLEEALGHAADRWIVAHRSTLDAALREIGSRLGLLEVTCNVSGAEIRLDGRGIGRTPLPGPLRVVAGQSVIQVLAKGYLEITRHVQVDALNLSRVDVRLTAIPVRDGAQVPSWSGPSELRVGGRNGASFSAKSRAEQGTTPRDVLMYTSLGLSALGVAVGVTGYVMREVNVDLYNDDSRCDVRPGIRRTEECPDESAAWRRGEVLAIGGFTAAGVFGATALYLWLDRPKLMQSRRLACGVGPSWLACSGKF